MYSYSTLHNYNICNKRYYFKHIEQLEYGENRFMEKGKNFHKFAKAFYDDYNKIIEDGLDPNKLLGFVADSENVQLDNIYRQFIKNELKRLSKYKTLPKLYPKYKVNGQIDGYDLIGTIDLLEEHPNNNYIILGLKTKKPAKVAPFRRQLGIYQMLLMNNNATIDNVDVGVYFYGTKNYWNETLSPKSLEMTRFWIQKTIGEIESGNYESSPSVFNCKYCVYKKSCEDRII